MVLQSNKKKLKKIGRIYYKAEKKNVKQNVVYLFKKKFDREEYYHYFKNK